MMCSLATSPAVDTTIVATSPRHFCWLCGKKREKLYEGMSDWLFGVPGKWALRSCGVCEVAWLDPQPNRSDLAKLYRHYYTHAAAELTTLGRIRVEAEKLVLQRMGYFIEPPREILPRLISHIPSFARAARLEVLNLTSSETGRLLDVGCGNGTFISRMQQFGWRVSGVDPDPAAVSHAQNQRLEVFHGTVSDVPLHPYDVITLNHVIEHVADPVDLLRECRKRLRPGAGRLIITTPNLKSFGHWWFKKYWRGLEVPRHLVLLSPLSLRKSIELSGLRVADMRTETRLARMIYIASGCARDGHADVGERVDFKKTTKLASYLFQTMEDSLGFLAKGFGEEIFCVCVAP